MEIGLISDTHGFLDPRVEEAFSDCDEIWHAGDVGDVAIIDRLAAIKPVRGVFGNIDDQAVRDRWPEDERFELEGVDVWITHIAGHPGRYDPRVRRGLQLAPPRLLVCGHSHLLRVEIDSRFGHLQYVNPGAAGHRGQHLIRTLMKLELVDGAIQRLRVVELGPRGRIARGANP